MSQKIIDQFRADGDAFEGFLNYEEVRLPSAHEVAVIAAHFVANGESLVDATAKACDLFMVSQRTVCRLRTMVFDSNLKYLSKRPAKSMAYLLEKLGLKSDRQIWGYVRAIWGDGRADELKRMSETRSSSVFSDEEVSTIVNYRKCCLKERAAQIAASKQKKASSATDDANSVQKKTLKK